MKNTTRIVCTTLLAAAVLCHTTACRNDVVRGKGPLTTQQRPLQSFNKIEIDMGLQAVIVIGDKYSVDLKAQENLLQHIRTEISNNTLRIHNDDVLMMKGDKITATIHLPELQGLEINGAADADIKGDLKTNTFMLGVSGAGDVKIERLHVSTLAVSLSGAAELDIKEGIAEQANYTVTGAGEIMAPKILTRKAEAHVTGAGEMKLHVTEALDAHITGAGEIDYTGHPKITSDITGAGNLSDRN